MKEDFDNFKQSIEQCILEAFKYLGVEGTKQFFNDFKYSEGETQ